MYGFGGLRCDGERLSLNPKLPKEWQKLSFYLTYRGSRMKVEITRDCTTVKHISGPEVIVELNGEEFTYTTAPESGTF